MKRFYFLAASMVLLAACSGLEQPERSLFNTDGDLVEKVIFEVLPIKDGDDPETRASAVPNGGTVGFVWEENDMIGIYPNKGSQIYFKIEDGAGSSSATFDGGGWALKQNASYVSYYPFVADFFLSRDEIPVSFAGQKQVGIESPFNGARYFLATEPTSSENGVLRFSYKTLNTIINVNATLPAGTYTKMSLTIEEPLFIEEGTYSLDEREIVGMKFSNALEIDLEDVVLTEEATIPIYIMSAPVDLKDKEVTVMVFSSDGNEYGCIKKPSKVYEAGTRYGLTCNEMEQSNVTFDDESFKTYCVENFDSDGDEEISHAEAKVVSSIDVSNKGISSLRGIEHFINLTYLNCYSNQLTSLDVSHNTALTELFCSYNPLTSLDVSRNTALEVLNCDSNQLTSLDVSQNTALKTLRCNVNYLASLDVSRNTALTTLQCSSNQLTSLDVSQNTILTTLQCNFNQLTSLDVSQNTALTWLRCYSNQLTSLDVSRNTALTRLECSSNQLTSLGVSLNTELEELSCSSNQLTSLDVSQNTALTTLQCSSNQLTSLDVSQNTALDNLNCASNQLTSLDVSQNTVLTSLNCRANPTLTEIWLKTGHFIAIFYYDTDMATIIYKD